MKIIIIKRIDDERWQSGDIDEERYRKTAKEFKNKWFGPRDTLLRRKIADQLRQTAEKLEEE